MQDVTAALQRAVKDLYKTNVEPELTRPDEQFGDYSTNVALKLAGELNKPPREVAQAIVDKLKTELKDELKDITLAGPGFINFTLSDKMLLDQVEKAPATKPLDYKDKVVVAEYSDPNPFKVLHAGHLYTTLVGDALANLFEAGGAKVYRVNYGGDVGLHVARAMWGILKNLGGAFPEKLDSIRKKERPAWMAQRYVEGTSAYEDSNQVGADPQVKIDIITLNKIIYNIHSDERPLLVLMTPCSLGADPKALQSASIEKIYWTCRQWSYEAFNDLYKELGVHEFERYLPESEIAPLGVDIVKQGLAKGIFEKSDGAVVFKGEDHGLHIRVFITSEGLPTYEAKDLGLAAKKWQDYKFDLSFIITGNDIVDYMKVVIKALEHFYPETASRGRHLTHGMIKLPGGKKMSSRKGNILQASDILEAAARASKASGRDNRQTVLGAVKYAFLKYRVGGGDIIYEPEESISLEGNSGPYLQYAHARACSILAKVAPEGRHPREGGDPVKNGIPSNWIPDRVGNDALQPQERSLARKISEYPEVLAKATDELMPHHICTYLYELTQAFNRFYEKNRVIGDPREAERLHLLQCYQHVLQDGLGLLGIEAPNKI